MGKHRENKGQNVVLAMEKDLTIGVVTDLKERILKELQTSDAVTLNLENIENIDIAGLQILCSANRCFEMNKKTFAIQTGDKFGFFKTFMIESGYDSNGSCPEGTCKMCLWKGDLKYHGKENSDS